MDYLPEELTSDIIFDISLDVDYPYNAGFEELRYEYHNSIYNLGSLFYYVTVHLMLYPVVFLVYIIERKTKKKAKWFKLSHSMIW